jgi:hypothetical protein
MFKIVSLEHLFKTSKPKCMHERWKPKCDTWNLKIKVQCLKLKTSRLECDVKKLELQDQNVMIKTWRLECVIKIKCKM